MISLMAYYGYSTPQEDRASVVWAAMAFSFLGDTLLMYENISSLYFIFGLAAFLISHVFYIFSYRQHRWDSSVNQLQGLQRLRLAFPIILAGTGLVVVLYPTLGELKIPVMLYAIVLVTMVLNALFRYGRTNNNSFTTAFAGSVLFMVSDSLLAVNKFYTAISYAGLLIMITYIAAQYLIVTGLRNHFRK